MDVVGVITTSYPRGPDDHAGNFVRTRVQELVRRGHTVEVLAAADPQQEPPVEDSPNVRVIRIPSGFHGASALFYREGAPEALETGGVAAWLQAIQFSARLAATMRERSVGWRRLESHWLVPCSVLGAAFAKDLHHRAHAHSGDVALLERLPGGASLARTLIMSGAEIIFPSADLRARFARLARTDAATLHARTRVEPAPIDHALFAPIPQAERASLRQRLRIRRHTVMSVGRLVPIKGFDLLVRAVGRLAPARRPNLVIAGEGPERERLVRLAESRGVQLQLLGAVAPCTVRDWLGAVDIYAQPSRVLDDGRSEGMPLAVREAIAIGVPVIAAASGGLGELSSMGGRVTLVPPGAAEALSAALAVHFSE